MIDKKELGAEEGTIHRKIAGKIAGIGGVEILSPAAFSIVRGAFPNHPMQVMTPQYEVDGEGKHWPYGLRKICTGWALQYIQRYVTVELDSAMLSLALAVPKDPRHVDRRTNR